MKYFSDISSEYQQNSLVQNSAADRLLKMAAIKKTDDVLDLGCGPGHVTARIREQSKGRVFGFDASEGMIGTARDTYKDRDIDFQVQPAENLIAIGQFDLIFCNSVFQWFRQPEVVIRKCFNALRTYGRLVMQAPATTRYCPVFLKALESVQASDKTRETFAKFRIPWFFADTVDAYTELFTRTAFIIQSAEIVQTSSSHTPGEVLRIFQSGAAAGYLNPDHYDTDWPASYESDFLALIQASLEKQATGGRIDLLFHRIFLHAEKPR